MSSHITRPGLIVRTGRPADAGRLAVLAMQVWLHAQNARAIEFYARQGFRKVGTAYFALGCGPHENHVLVGLDATGCLAR